MCIESASHVRLIFEAAVEVVHVDDSDCSKKYALALRRGALLYALKIDAQWEPFYPETETPLPKQWPWYNVRPVPVKADGADFFENQGLIREKYPWNVAVDETLRPEQIRVERCSTEGYPWEEPYIRLHVPAYRAPMYSAPYDAVHRAVVHYSHWLDHDSGFRHRRDSAQRRSLPPQKALPGHDPLCRPGDDAGSVPAIYGNIIVTISQCGYPNSAAASFFCFHLHNLPKS